MPQRLTVLFCRDSFVAGIGDPTGLGWTGRLAAGRRVPPADTVASLRAIVGRASSLGLATLVVGPPPIADPRINDRIVELDALLADEARTLRVAVVPVVHDLLADEGWMSEVHAGDGAHPGARGYAALAALVRPRWETWRAALVG